MAVFIGTKIAAFLANPVVGFLLTLADYIMTGYDIYDFLNQLGVFKYTGEFISGGAGMGQVRSNDFFVAGFRDPKNPNNFITYDDYDKIFEVTAYEDITFDEENPTGGIIPETVPKEVQDDASLEKMYEQIRNLAEGTKQALETVVAEGLRVAQLHPQGATTVSKLQEVLTGWRYAEATIANDQAYIENVLETLCITAVDMANLYGPINVPEFTQLYLFLDGDQMLSIGVVQLCNYTYNWLTSVYDTFQAMITELDEFCAMYEYLGNAGNLVQEHGINYWFFAYLQSYYLNNVLKTEMFVNENAFVFYINIMLTHARNSIEYYSTVLPIEYRLTMEIFIGEMQNITNRDMRFLNYKTQTMISITTFYRQYADGGGDPASVENNIAVQLSQSYSLVVDNHKRINDVKQAMGEPLMPPLMDITINSVQDLGAVQAMVSETERALILARIFAREVGI